MERNDLLTNLIERVRNRLLDVDPEENMLEGKLEFDDPRIEGALKESLYRSNDTSPEEYFSIYDYPRKSILVQGAVAQLLEARGLLHLRNQINYNDAGLSVGIEDKHQFYQQAAAMAQQEFQRMLADYKKTVIPDMLGISSPYDYL